VLAEVPGVYIRQEDGYGLRPNIGMRGATSERSAKIALLEDGVPIAPAPYSAPAAYYFPLVTKLVGIDVIKGPSAIIYGPNTVGGALDLQTKPIPEGTELMVDAAGGSDLYGKLHASFGLDEGHFGFLVEGAKLRSSGFKDLDGGGLTGFDRNDVTLKARARTSPGDRFQSLELKVGLATEVSHETYTGLTDADFARTPYRRYAATELDKMDWTHLQLQLTHKLTVPGLALTTVVYRNTFDRKWRKLDGFAGGRSLPEVLASPESGQNAVLYAILAGDADSTSTAESVVLGTNDRSFVSQGVEVRGKIAMPGSLPQELEVGARFHHDHADRFHTEETYAMAGGSPVRDSVPMTVTLDAVGSAHALAGFARHKLTLGPVELGAGLRVEQVWTRLDNDADPSLSVSGSYTALLPGGGLVYRPIPWVAVVAGVHRGFVPVAPGEESHASAETSVNYEAGVRIGHERVRGEVIGFFSDYSNLKGHCTFSAECEGEMLDDEFDGGRVHIFGVEVAAQTELRWQKLRFPAGVTYTLTKSSFRTGFVSENPEWGTVEPGDELPYLPVHQLGVHGGVGGERWEVTLAGRYISPMRDVAGQGDTPPQERTDSQLVMDAAAYVSFADWGKVYLTVDNVFDAANIVARRPYGARPGVPRLVVVGCKTTF